MGNIDSEKKSPVPSKGRGRCSFPSGIQLGESALEKMSRVCSHLDAEVSKVSSDDAFHVKVLPPQPPVSPNSPSAARVFTQQSFTSTVFSFYEPRDFSKKVAIPLPVEVVEALRFLSSLAGRRATQRDILCNLILYCASVFGYEPPSKG